MLELQNGRTIGLFSQLSVRMSIFLQEVRYETRNRREMQVVRRAFLVDEELGLKLKHSLSLF